MGVEGVAGAEPSRAGLRVARGPRAAQAAILDEVARHVEASAADPSGALAAPLRILVPSKSLRLHLCAALVDHFGRPLAGVVVQTLHAAALEVHDRCGERPPPSDSLFPIVVRQHARREPALRESLESLVDGYGAVEAGVSDLLDAGFESHHAEALAEFLTASQFGRGAAAHGRALVRVAAATLASHERREVGHRSQLLRTAADLLAKQPTAALPARGLLIHGFADATGAAADLIVAAIRYASGRIVLDEVPEPGATGPAPGTEGYTRRFRSQVESAVVDAVAAVPDPTDEQPVFTLFDAPGAEAEARAVALRLQRMIARGVRPERVAVVARDLSAYTQPLRRHLTRFGVPFSAVSAPGPGGARSRRLEAALALLRAGTAAPVDRWLDALSPDGAKAEIERARSDLRLALRRHGAARLSDAVGLDETRRGVALPVRSGLHAPEEDGHVGAPRRWLAAPVWNAALGALRAAHRRLDAWSPEAGLGAHREALGALLRTDLGWRDDDPLAKGLLDRLADSDDEFVATREDFVLLVTRAARELANDRFGGAGGGVQVLGVMEARARCFDQLFVLGLNRDAFPRVVGEDPLLPDAVRLRLRDLLPDLPVKADGHDEERYLFAQLAASAPSVTLSWQSCGDDGKPRSASSLVDRLLRARPEFEVAHVGGEHARPGADVRDAVRPAREHALQTALHGPDDRFARVLALALAPLAAVADVAPPALARARNAVVREMDLPPGRGPRGLGPFYGFVGAVQEPADPRRAEPWVTALEQNARCPWQHFVEKLLRIEPPPDPVEALPDVDALLLGSAVHRVLEAIGGGESHEGRRGRRESDDEGTRETLSLLRDRPGHPVEWPDAATLDALITRETRRLVDDSGTWLPGLSLVLARRALPHLLRARALAWPAPAVLGVEVPGALEIDSDAGPRVVHFVADRVDRDDEGLVLIDYKTGRPPSNGAKPATRRKKLLESVRLGKLLQATAYALASDGRGRYTYLRPEDSDDVARCEIDAADPEFRAAFQQTTRTLLRARDAGAFFPRLADGTDRSQDHPQCRNCAVAQACLHGDSGAKRRLIEWVEAAREERAPIDGDRAAHAALLSLFDVGSEAEAGRAQAAGSDSGADEGRGA